jgi:hypothetical protein
MSSFWEMYVFVWPQQPLADVVLELCGASAAADARVREALAGWSLAAGSPNSRQGLPTPGRRRFRAGLIAQGLSNRLRCAHSANPPPAVVI